jgi:hypothetical protein
LQIPGMTRSDVKTMIWLAPLAVWLTLWWMLRGTPCLKNELENRWSEWFPPPPVVIAAPGGPDGITVYNPYGIVACDYFPETIDHVISLLTIILIAALVGFVAARRFEQWPVKRAATIMALALTMAFALANFAFLPGLLRLVDDFGYKPVAIEVGLSLVSIVIGVLLTMLAAWLTSKWRPHG